MEVKKKKKSKKWQKGRENFEVNENWSQVYSHSFAENNTLNIFNTRKKRKSKLLSKKWNMHVVYKKEWK